MARQRYRVVPIVLGAVYILTLGLRPLLAPDETRYGEIAREMVATGDWTVPHLLAVRYFEKPVLGYWLDSLAQLLFGHSAFAVRFASALCALLTAVVVALLAARIGGERRIGERAATVYLATLLVYAIGTTSVLDGILTLWLTAAMAVCYAAFEARTTGERLRRYAVFGAFCGLAFLTKGFVALAVPVVAAVPFALMQRRLRELLVWGWVAIAAAGLVALPWSIAIHLREPDYWRYFFWEEHVRRFAGDDAQHAQPFWYYVPVMLVGALPWTGALPAALRGLARRPELALARRFLLAWLIMPVLLFSAASGKLATYVLPCFAPLAILVALGLAGRAAEDRHAPAPRLAGWLNLGFAALLAAALPLLVRRHGVVAEGEAVLGSTATAALALAVVAWGGIGWFAGTRRGTTALTWLALAPLLLMVALPLVPLERLDFGNTPGPFIRAQAASIPADAVVVGERSTLAEALGWYLERSDIVVLEPVGELGYGLAYPDASGRLLTRSGFPAWLRRTRATRSVVVFFETRRAPSRPWLPTPDRSTTDLGFTVNVYEANKKTGTF